VTVTHIPEEFPEEELPEFRTAQPEQKNKRKIMTMEIKIKVLFNKFFDEKVTRNQACQ
jgi:hypothetical protein